MSDAFNRNLVVLIFLVSYMYMNFISLQIRTRSGWSNLTCNPLNLFANSLFQTQEDANTDFERCIVNLSSATTTNLFKKQKQEQENVLTKLSDVKSEYGDLTTNVQRYVRDASNLTQEYTHQINSLESAQAQANELNANTSGKVSNYLANMRNMFENITNFFKKN
jgi:ABC-type transporter Mla subunit MlaD